MNRRFVVCAVCRYHMRPDQVIEERGRLVCINAARCNGRVNQRLRDKQAAGKGRR